MATQLETGYHLKVHEIASVLIDAKTIGPMGLIEGDLGRLLFLLHYAEATNSNVVFERAMNEIERHISEVDFVQSGYSFCSGVAGLCWTVEYIQQKGWLDADTNELLKPIDEYLHQILMQTLEDDNFDFLQGSVGIAHYFMSRISKSKQALEFVHEYIQGLTRKAVIEDDNSCKWIFRDLITGEKRIDDVNLGLAHGMPAILSLLTKFYNAKILANETRAMIKSATAFILKNQMDIRQSSSYFPYSEKKRNPNTRLAWCYGDLSICCSLWQAVAILKDSKLRTFINDVLVNATNIKAPELTRVVDGGLCHGSAGVAHIFRRFFDMTGDQRFKEASEYWYSETLRLATHNDGYAGYMAVISYPGQSQPKKICSIGLLEGISGIGLALLYKVFGKVPTWESAMLIT